MTELLNKVTQGDCLEVMKQITDTSVDLIVIDPPYNIGKDKRWDKWNKVDDYVAFMSEVFKECERVLKPTGSFYWFHNDMAQVARLMLALESETDFIYKNLIVWNKRYEGSRRKYYFDNVISKKNDNEFRQLSEYCLFYTKNTRKYYTDIFKKYGFTPNRVDHEILGVKRTASYWCYETNHGHVIPSEEHVSKLKEYMPEIERLTFNNLNEHHDVWNYEVAPKVGHVTPKPVDLIENIIRHSSNEGDIVLDCFLGSGTTAVAAINTNRQFIGIERETGYVEIANKRIQEVVD